MELCEEPKLDASHEGSFFEPGPRDTERRKNVFFVIAICATVMFLIFLLALSVFIPNRSSYVFAKHRYIPPYNETASTLLPTRSAPHEKLWFWR